MAEQMQYTSTSDVPKQGQASDSIDQTDSKNILSTKKGNRLVVVPKRIVREEIVEELVLVDEVVVEVANRVVQEKIIEVPEIEYREKIVEVVEKKVEEKVIEVPKVEYCERLIEVPRYITQEKYVEVPQIEYRDVITERTVSIPEVYQDFLIKEVEVPQYVDDQGLPVQRPILEIERKIPAPVEAVTTYEYQLAQFRPRVKKVKYPMYVPRFIPIPVVAETIKAEQLAEMQQLNESVNKLVGPQALSLTEVGDLANAIHECNHVSNLPSVEEAHQTIREKWLTGQLYVASTDAAPDVVSQQS